MFTIQMYLELLRMTKRELHKVQFLSSPQHYDMTGYLKGSTALYVQLVTIRVPGLG